MVLLFEGESDADNKAFLGGADFEKISKDWAVFVRFAHNPNRDRAPGDTAVVPVSRLLSDNPARDYDVAAGKITLVVADWHGNAYFTLTKKPTADDLKATLKKVPAKMEDAEKRLQKNLDAAKTAWEKKDRATALKSLLKNFKEGFVGLAAQDGTTKLYHEILDAARADLKTLQDKGDKAGLEKLAQELKGTDAAKEADEALKGLN